MANDNLMDQDEIERLLSQSKPAAPPAGAEPAAAESSPAGEASSSPAKPPGKPSPAPAADADKVLAQDDIEKLLSQAGKAKPAAAPAAAAAKEKEPPAPNFPGEGSIPDRDVELLLTQAEQALASISASAGLDLPQGVSSFRLEEFSGATASTETATIDLVRDVELDLRIELGRTHMYLEDVLKLRKGSVVPLDKLAGDPVDIYVNGRLVARGEVLVLNDNFCVRVAELVAGTNVFA
jgi:flagellar motor switch protein FliN/FliY